MRNSVLPATAAALLLMSSTSSDAAVCPRLMPYYQAGLPPKALALSDSGMCSYSVNRDGGCRTLETAKLEALKYCQQGGGRNCRIIRADN